MVQEKKQKIRVFLSSCAFKKSSINERLLKIMQRAGMEVVFVPTLEKASKDELISATRRAIEQTDCSVHVLLNECETINNETVTELQFSEARNTLNNNRLNYRIFLWQPQNLAIHSVDNKDFVDTVRNSIQRNMVFSNYNSPVMFVEDIRSVMESRTEKITQSIESDIFFIYNELDEDEAIQIFDLLQDVLSIEKLNIEHDGKTSYDEYVVEQSLKSRMMVIYFKRTRDWAVSFVKQVWKNTGGASAATPILIIGDTDNPQHELFNAPNVVALSVSEELIPLEIKVQYDKLAENK